jgi:hypothetical protein
MGDGFVMSGNIKYIIRVVTGRSRNVKEKGPPWQPFIK